MAFIGEKWHVEYFPEVLYVGVWQILNTRCKELAPPFDKRMLMFAKYIILHWVLRFHHLIIRHSDTFCGVGVCTKSHLLSQPVFCGHNINLHYDGRYKG